jgi:CO/xanthine dehydrogenase FAD-binding subunit
MSMPVNPGSLMSAYARPATLDQALALVASGCARVLAGGTDLYPGAGTRLGGNVVDVTAIAEMTAISRADAGLRIGAAVRWGQLAKAPLPPALHALQQAAVQVGGRQIQNVGTIGGNLCNASPAADGMPPLLIANAQVEIRGPQGLRLVPLAGFVTAPRRVALLVGEIVTAIVVPDAGLRGKSAFEKLGARTHLVISIAMAAARIVIAEGMVVEAAISVGSCSGVAQRLRAVEAALAGVAVSGLNERILRGDVAAALAPIDDVRATAAYRTEAATELVRHVCLRAVA